MGIGSAIRHRLGRWEIPAANAYRGRFINLADLATTLASISSPKRILEIGCGEGAFGEELLRVFPSADYLGIDICPEPGRLFRGDDSRAEFRKMLSTDLLAEKPEPFDLVAIVDVVHHVSEDLRSVVLRDAAALTAPTGLLAVKEWEKGTGLSHLVAYTADRYVTGDKDVRFLDGPELSNLLAEGLPEFEIVCETRIPPRRNNVLFALRRP